MNIFYLHGLGSSSNTSTVGKLRKLYPNHNWYAIDVYPQLDKSLDIINEFVKTHKIDVLMGTSMGGLQTLAADFDGTKIAINPPLHTDFTEVMGTNVPYFVKRVNEEETTFSFTKEDAEKIWSFNLKDKVTPSTFIVCSTHDELLGDMSSYAEELMSEHKNDGKNHIIRTSSLGHRMSDEFIEFDLMLILNDLIF